MGLRGPTKKAVWETSIVRIILFVLSLRPRDGAPNTAASGESPFQQPQEVVRPAAISPFLQMNPAWLLALSSHILHTGQYIGCRVAVSIGPPPLPHLHGMVSLREAALRPLESFLPWWEHDFGHLEATMLGQLEARMKMMPGGPKLCSHHRLAGPRQDQPC